MTDRTQLRNEVLERLLGDLDTEQKAKVYLNYRRSVNKFLPKLKDEFEENAKKIDEKQADTILKWLFDLLPDGSQGNFIASCWNTAYAEKPEPEKAFGDKVDEAILTQKQVEAREKAKTNPGKRGRKPKTEAKKPKKSKEKASKKSKEAPALVLNKDSESLTNFENIFNSIGAVLYRSAKKYLVKDNGNATNEERIRKGLPFEVTISKKSSPKSLMISRK